MQTIGRLPPDPASAAPANPLLSLRNTGRCALRRLTEFLRGKTKANAPGRPSLRPFVHRCTALPSDGSIADWRASLNAKHLSEFASYFYLADGDGKVCGRLPLHVLFHNPHPEDIWAECEPDPVVVTVEMNPVQVWRWMRRCNYSELPVCGERGRFLGVIYRGVLARHILKEIFRNREQHARQQGLSAALIAPLNNAREK
jgi:hypothetical protein